MNEPRSLLRAVLDTNIYVSGTILSLGAPFRLLEAWRQQAYILVSSELIILEIARVFYYPRIKERYGIDDEDIAQLLASIKADALLVAGDYEVTDVSVDPNDDMFLACALEGEADYIVTGDPDLLNLKYYQGIQIVTASQFLDRLNELTEKQNR